MTENTVNTTEQKEQILKTVDEVLNAIKQKASTYASQIWVPSMQKDVRFCELNTAQQKRLIKSILDSPILNTEFNYTLRDIIKENCADKSLDVNKLTILDKLLIALGIRINSIGSDLPVEVTVKSGDKVTINLDLKKVYEIAKTTTQNIAPQVFTDEIYFVQCSVPSIETELKIEGDMKDSMGDVSGQTETQLRTTVGDAFVGEIAKYITALSIKSDTGETHVAWNGFTLKERTQIVESFSSKLLKQVVAYITSVRNEMEKIEVINFEFKGEKFTRRLSIDGSFFMIF